MSASSVLSQPEPTEVLTSSPLPQLRRLVVTVSEGEVVITGRVPSYYFKQLAQEAIRPSLGRRRLLPALPVLSEPAKERTRCGTGGRTLSGIAPDGPRDGSDCGAASRSAHHATGGLSGRSGIGVMAALLHGPAVAFALVLVLLLGRLSLHRIDIGLLPHGGDGWHRDQRRRHYDQLVDPHCSSLP